MIFSGLIRVNRDQMGRRDYSENDVEWVKFIQRLKDTGMLLRDIKNYSDLRYQGDSTMEERMELLIRHRESVVIQNVFDILQNMQQSNCFQIACRQRQIPHRLQTAKECFPRYEIQDNPGNRVKTLIQR